MLPLQVPGGIEMLIILSILGVQIIVPAILLTVLVYRDADGKDSDHALAWALGALFGGPVVWVLYFVVRDEIGSAGESASGVSASRDTGPV